MEEVHLRHPRPWRLGALKSPGQPAQEAGPLVPRLQGLWEGVGPTLRRRRRVHHCGGREGQGSPPHHHSSLEHRRGPSADGAWGIGRCGPRGGEGQEAQPLWTRHTHRWWPPTTPDVEGVPRRDPGLVESPLLLRRKGRGTSCGEKGGPGLRGVKQTGPVLQGARGWVPLLWIKESGPAPSVGGPNYPGDLGTGRQGRPRYRKAPEGDWMVGASASGTREEAPVGPVDHKSPNGGNSLCTRPKRSTGEEALGAGPHRGRWNPGEVGIGERISAKGKGGGPSNPGR